MRAGISLLHWFILLININILLYIYRYHINCNNAKKNLQFQDIDHIFIVSVTKMNES